MLTKIAYTQDELISATDIVRNFSNILDKLVKKKHKRYAILRKNKLEGVILSVEEYEKLENFKELLEDFNLYQEAAERLSTPKEKYIDFENVMKGSKLS